MDEAMVAEALGPVAAALVKIARREIDTLRAQNVRMLGLLRTIAKEGWVGSGMQTDNELRDLLSDFPVT